MNISKQKITLIFSIATLIDADNFHNYEFCVR